MLIQKLRLQRGWSQEQLAELGNHAEVISALCNERLIAFDAF